MPEVARPLGRQIQVLRAPGRQKLGAERQKREAAERQTQEERRMREVEPHKPAVELRSRHQRAWFHQADLPGEAVRQDRPRKPEAERQKPEAERQKPEVERQKPEAPVELQEHQIQAEPQVVVLRSPLGAALRRGLAVRHKEPVPAHQVDWAEAVHHPQSLCP
jgi:hypothetical protein